jgi:hypothetical protein
MGDYDQDQEHQPSLRYGSHLREATTRQAAGEQEGFSTPFNSLNPPPLQRFNNSTIQQFNNSTI